MIDEIKRPRFSLYGAPRCPYCRADGWMMETATPIGYEPSGQVALEDYSVDVPNEGSRVYPYENLYVFSFCCTAYRTHAEYGPRAARAYLARWRRNHRETWHRRVFRGRRMK